MRETIAVPQGAIKGTFTKSNPAHVRARAQAIADMADAGYTRAEIAKALNVSKPMLCMWARRENMQELHDKVKDIRDPRAFNYEKVKSRLRDLIVAKENGMTRTEVARAWGVSPAAVTQWVKRNAPDGVEDAYSDYMED